MAVHLLRQAFALALVSFFPPALLAQLATTVDGGVARVRYTGGDASTVFTLTPALTFEHQRGVVMGAATLSHFAEGGEAVQAAVAGSYFAGSWRALHLSVGAAAEGGNYGRDVNTSSLVGDARAHLVMQGRGGWAAVSHGVANDAVITRSLTRAELGGWVQRGAITAALWAMPSFVEGGIRYTDVQSSVRWASGALELSGALGARDGNAGSATWGSATAAYWLTPHLAVVGSGGSFASDPGQALPAGEFATLSVRLASRPTPRRVEARRPTPVTPPPVARPVVATFDVVRGREDDCTITIVARGARTVEIMGDFTDWQTYQLQSAGADRWRITLPITAGTHRFNIRVDGRDWGVPPGVTALQDEFSGVVAVLYIN